MHKHGDPHLIGAPFYAEGFYAPDNKADKRPMYEIGWTEPNLIQITDPEHIWCEPTGHTFRLLFRAHTGSTNLARLAKAVESPDGEELQSISSGPRLVNPFFMPPSLAGRCGSTSSSTSRASSIGWSRRNRQTR